MFTWRAARGTALCWSPTRLHPSGESKARGFALELAPVWGDGLGILGNINQRVLKATVHSHSSRILMGFCGESFWVTQHSCFSPKTSPSFPHLAFSQMKCAVSQAPTGSIGCWGL